MQMIYIDITQIFLPLEKIVAAIGFLEVTQCGSLSFISDIIHQQHDGCTFSLIHMPLHNLTDGGNAATISTGRQKAVGASPHDDKRRQNISSFH